MWQPGRSHNEMLRRKPQGSEASITSKHGSQASNPTANSSAHTAYRGRGFPISRLLDGKLRAGSSNLLCPRNLQGKGPLKEGLRGFSTESSSGSNSSRVLGLNLMSPTQAPQTLIYGEQHHGNLWNSLVHWILPTWSSNCAPDKVLFLCVQVYAWVHTYMCSAGNQTHSTT